MNVKYGFRQDFFISFWFPESSVLNLEQNLEGSNEQMHTKAPLQYKILDKYGVIQTHKKLVKNRWCVLDQCFTAGSVHCLTPS